ncbi:bleomycin resistance protein [Paraflavitalea soli]|uniref:Bleomycin resistance protein n=1 Tax=Paraflavitalea soli TaxID=2315862 RepID=A0A3B7MZ09_9BACT|nr:VOC family protein [Paraflavitalea soli]AXY75531.1 bleomycin resistance protein [Paraflavitalea soli]
MRNYLGRMILLVEDYDKAFEFYHRNFGFGKIFELTTDVGQRFLHIGSGATGEAGIWFLQAEGKVQQSRIGNQVGEQPAMVIYTSNLTELYQQLQENGVKIKTAPVITPGYSFLHCYDLYGNEIVVVEMA